MSLICCILKQLNRQEFNFSVFKGQITANNEALACLTSVILISGFEYSDLSVDIELTQSVCGESNALHGNYAHDGEKFVMDGASVQWVEMSGHREFLGRWEATNIAGNSLHLWREETLSPPYLAGWRFGFFTIDMFTKCFTVYIPPSTC